MISLGNRHLRRVAWYGLGLLLFYTPFAYYEKIMLWLLDGPAYRATFHGVCLRMPVLNLFTGKGVEIFALGTLSTLLLLASAFLAGPFFCGRLCAAGAVPEYLGRLWPDKWKMDWTQGVNPAPIRYGFFAGYLLAPYISASLACSFCNYGFLERLMQGGLWGQFGVMGSTAILTAFLWLVVFGVFTKGGRGFCTFLCPVGAVQNLLYSIGARFGFTYKLRFDRDRCVSCHLCARVCPMGALQEAPTGVAYRIHNCLTCRECASVCPTRAITYGRGEAGWQPAGSPEGQVEPVAVREGAG